MYLHHVSLSHTFFFLLFCNIHKNLLLSIIRIWTTTENPRRKYAYIHYFQRKEKNRKVVKKEEEKKKKILKNGCPHLLAVQPGGHPASNVRPRN